MTKVSCIICWALRTVVITFPKKSEGGPKHVTVACDELVFFDAQLELGMLTGATRAAFRQAQFNAIQNAMTRRPSHIRLVQAAPRQVHRVMKYTFSQVLRILF